MYSSNIQGKSVLISFPAHELHLIDELDRLAHLEMTSKSQYIRRLIRKDIRKVDEHYSNQHTYHRHIHAQYQHIKGASSDAARNSKKEEDESKSVCRTNNRRCVQREEVKCLPYISHIIHLLSSTTINKWQRCIPLRKIPSVLCLSLWIISPKGPE